MRKALCLGLLTFIAILAVVCTLLLLTSCQGNQYGNSEYEVISVTTYPVITGKTDTGPKEETRVAFIYMDNGDPKMVKDYFIKDQPTYATYIVVGDTNKYVIVREYRNETKYLYLTQETYDSLFPESEK